MISYVLGIAFASAPPPDIEESGFQLEMVTLSMLAERCDAEPSACHRLGRRHEQGIGGASVSMPDAARWFGRGCDAGLPFDCGLAAIASFRADDPKAAAFATRGCKADDAPSCAMLGHLELLGVGVPADPRSGVTRLEAGCTAGLPFACASLAIAWGGGVPGAPTDPVKARPLLEAACAGGEPAACVLFAAQLLEGRGGAADSARGLALLQSGCDSGLPDRCEMLAGAWLNGTGVGRDVSKAVAPLTRACELGSGPACASLSQLTLRGEGGLIADRAKALGLVQRSCTLGFADACKELDSACASGVKDACR